MAWSKEEKIVCPKCESKLRIKIGNKNDPRQVKKVYCPFCGLEIKFRVENGQIHFS